MAAAILGGDAMTGVTIMLLDEGMDSGPVLAQRPEPVRPDDTTQSLTLRLAVAGAELLAETLPRWLAGQIQPLSQDPALATTCPRISKEDGEIDWTRPAEEIARRVRAYYPWPGSVTRWRGKGLKVIRGQAVTERAGEPGTAALVKTEAGMALAIACGWGALRIDEVQPEGRRPMSAREFLAGYKAIAGERLPS